MKQFALPRHSGHPMQVSIVRGYRRIELYIWQPTNGNSEFVAAPMEFVERQTEGYYEPALSLDGDLPQQIMDGLWNAGIRPSNALASTGQVEATQKHLGDMRALVAQTLKVELP